MMAICFQSNCCMSFTIPGAMALSEATGRRKVGKLFLSDNRGDVEAVDTCTKAYHGNNIRIYTIIIYWMHLCHKITCTRFQNGARLATGWVATEQSAPMMRISVSLLLVIWSMKPCTAGVLLHCRAGNSEDLRLCHDLSCQTCQSIWIECIFYYENITYCNLCI